MPDILRRTREAAAKLWPPIASRCQQAQDWARRNPQTVLCVAGGTAAVALLILLIADWKPYRKHHQAFAPILTLAAGLAVAGVTLMRHFAQTEADRQRRITESFSKAVEQLAYKDIEVRLGGIYTLERISKESPDDYWTVMETLTAFVRERTRPEAERLEKPREQRRSERARKLWEEAGKPEGRDEEFWNKAVEQEASLEPPATDIVAVLTVITRRSEARRALEIREKRVLDLRRVVLRGADLGGAHLEGATLNEAHLEYTSLWGTHLEGATLNKAHLEHARLFGTHLERALLMWAHLEHALLPEAHLEHASLWGTRLEGAILNGARLEGARLINAHLEGADLRGATGLTQTQIEAAFGDADTKLSEGNGLTRPKDWTGQAPGQPAL